MTSQVLQPELLGAAMTAYYGGRAEGRIRRTVVPVVYCDFLSMYPTVNTLMGLWELLTAERLEVVDAIDEVRRFLEQVDIDACFDPTLWPQLACFGLVAPDGDILPVRAQYDSSGSAFTIGVNPLTSDTPLWYAGPDLAASTLLTGRPPKVLKAFRLVPKGRQRGLCTVRLRGAVRVNPSKQDFFRAVIEARKALGQDPTHSEGHRGLDQFLKVLANSGSYGVFAEMNREDARIGAHFDINVYGLDGAFAARTTAVEKPGKFCFPPFAALTTAAARLKLALLERCVTDAGGTYAFCDTDSMAIVSTESGGLVPCPGGPPALPNRTPAVRALSRRQVDGIVARFEALNPYDRSVVTGSVLKIEGENYDEQGARWQLYTYVISAKRYALFTRDPDGGVTIRKYSEHGLGHLLNPIDPERDDRDWIRQLWDHIVREALGQPAMPFPWLSRPAMSRLTISSPHLYRPFDVTRRQLPYAERVKPMNFVLSPVVAPFGHPEGIDAKKFHLISSFSTDPRRWQLQHWTDIHSRERYGISTSPHAGGRVVQVKSYGDVLAAYRTHPEPKSADAEGRPCDRATVGLLQRRPVHAASIVYQGKEGNRVEEVEYGLVHDWDAVQAVYRDPRLDPWVTTVIPMLKTIPSTVLAQESNLHQRTIKRLRNGHGRPRPEHRNLLIRIAVEHARELVADASTDPAVLRHAQRLLRSPLAQAIDAERQRRRAAVRSKRKKVRRIG